MSDEGISIGYVVRYTNHEGIGIKYENAEIRSLSSLRSYSFFILTVALERLHGTLPMRRDPVGAGFAGMRGRLTRGINSKKKGIAKW